MALRNPKGRRKTRMFMPGIGFGCGMSPMWGMAPMAFMGGMYGIGMGMMGAPMMAYNPAGAMMGGYAGGSIGSSLGMLLGVGLGSSMGPMGMMGGAALGSMLGGGIGWGIGTHIGGKSNPFGPFYPPCMMF
jgi:hypothetical protein